jgi:hypothetical protein
MRNEQGVNYKMLAPDEVDYSSLAPDELVNLLAYVSHRNRVIIALVGGLTGTELRRVRLTDDARNALIRGLDHENRRVRWRRLP